MRVNNGCSHSLEVARVDVLGAAAGGDLSGFPSSSSLSLMTKLSSPLSSTFIHPSEGSSDEESDSISQFCQAA
jgi:hypothetical protein